MVSICLNFGSFCGESKREPEESRRTLEMVLKKHLLFRSFVNCAEFGLQTGRTTARDLLVPNGVQCSDRVTNKLANLCG